MARRMIHLKALRDKTIWRATAPSVFLVINTFVWFVLTYVVFTGIVNSLALGQTEKLSLYATYFLGIAVSAILSSKFLSHARSWLLNVWLIIGTLATILLSTVSSNGMLPNVLIAIFFGVSIGVGLPSCLSYFADSTSVENRGSIGGLTWSGVGFGILFFAILLNFFGQFEAIIALAIWRLLGSVIFLVLNKPKQTTNTQKSPDYIQIIRKKEILLYLVPWIMISLINYAEAPMIQRVFDLAFGQNTYIFMQLIEWVLIGISAIIGGIVADITGRKRVIIAGFVLLGVEYAALSIFSSSAAVLYLFLVLDGVTWGLLFSVFFTTLWGDLGENYGKEKFYTLGGLPYLLANFLSIIIAPYANGISVGTAFSYASFFLFVAVIPLMYAAETLPEKAIKDRDLKSYLEKAQKVALKESQKTNKKEENQLQKQDKEATEEKDDKDYEEAKKLAEKYY
jgi:MFS family permease